MKKIIGLWMICLHVCAFQTFQVKNGSEVTASIYQSGLSRIYLQDDRISTIKGLAGEFQIDKNDEIGDIYIKPLASRSADDFDLFIQTEKGNTYSLILRVNADKPESIRLDAIDLVAPVQTMVGQEKDNQAMIIKLIKVASQGSEIKGYSSEVFAEPNRLSLRKNVVSILEKSYQGKDYRIDVLRVENNTKDHINIHEQDFAVGLNVVAVSVENRSLGENENTRAYRVVKL